MASEQNERAKLFTSLHRPGNPIILTNCWDAVTARAIGALPGCQALATASYAVAEAAGYADNDMPLEVNLHAVRGIAKAAADLGKPLTVDLQDAYGARLDEAVAGIIALGAVGANIEDVDQAARSLYPLEDNVARLRRVLEVAARHGVPDFHINARCDALLFGGTVEDAVGRARAYIAAGAKTAFVWGGGTRGGISRDEVVALCKGVDGLLNVSMRTAPGNLTAKDLAEIGVARISIGPALQFVGVEAVKNAAKTLLER